MRKLFLLSCAFLFGPLSHAQYDPSVSIQNRTRSIIDAREVTDPSKDNRLFSPKKADAQSTLKNLPYTTASMFKSLVTTSSYPVIGFVPKTNHSDTFHLSGIGKISLIDARFGNEKVGFIPVGYSLQKKGYSILGMQIEQSPTEWLKEEIIKRSVQEDTSSERKLTIVLQKLWFSQSASDRYTASNPRLVTTLHYSFAVYTTLNLGYYPQKKINGSFSAAYQDGQGINHLSDSLLTLLNREIFSSDYAAKETETNWLSPVDFNDYYNQRAKVAAHPEKIPKGIYRTYADYVAGKPESDSVEMMVKYNNYDRAITYACLLTAFVGGQPVSSNKSWGYFDGTSLFVNTGNGFYIRLVRSKTDYVFFHLKNIHEDRIKPDLLNSIRIGASSYHTLIDYTKAYGLVYQLDYDTGELY